MINWYLVLLFSFLDNEQICLGEYVQVFRGMFIKLGITGKESSAVGGFAFPFGEGKREGGPQWLKAKVAYCL